jgi:hypothetical protein
MKTKPKSTRMTKAQHESMARSLFFAAVSSLSKHRQFKRHLNSTIDELMLDFIARKYDLRLERSGFLGATIAYNLSDMICGVILSELKAYTKRKR